MFSYFSKLFFRSGEAINIPSVKIHEIETAAEKPSCALKHLLKLNHTNHAILFNERRFHNHLPHVGYCPLSVLHIFLALV
jgi:hypothetical protein